MPSSRDWSATVSKKLCLPCVSQPPRGADLLSFRKVVAHGQPNASDRPIKILIDIYDPQSYRFSCYPKSISENMKLLGEVTVGGRLTQL
jgi:hypothetical protein